MAKAAKQQVISNRMRNVQRGTYTDVYRQEREFELQRKSHLAASISRCRIKW